MVDRAEAFLHDDCDFTQLRARHHETLARIELPAEDLSRLLADAELRQRLVMRLSEIGYLQITADLYGFRSGSMNEVLLKIDSDDTPLFVRVDPVLEAYTLVPAAYEERDQMLVLRLPEAAGAQLADAQLRSTFVAALTALGPRYIALDLDPLHI